MWDSAGALKRRTAMKLDVLSLMEEWKLWSAKKETERQAAREAKRKAKEAKDVQLPSAQEQEGASVPPETTSADSATTEDDSEESSDGDIEMIVTEGAKRSPRKSPRKGRRGKTSGDVEPPSSSQQTIKVAPSITRSREQSPGPYVTSKRTSTPDPPDTGRAMASAPSSPSRDMEIVVEVPGSSKASGTARPPSSSVSSSRKHLSETAMPADLPMDIDHPPEAHGRDQSMAGTLSDDESSEKSDSENSGEETPRQRPQTLYGTSSTSRHVLGRTADAIAHNMDRLIEGDPKNLQVSDKSTMPLLPLDQSNSESCKAAGDDSFVYNKPKSPDLLFSQIREHLSQGSSQSEPIRADAGKYDVPVNFGLDTNSSPVSTSQAKLSASAPSLNASSSMPSSTREPADPPGRRPVVTSKFFPNAQESKRKREASAEVDESRESSQGQSQSTQGSQHLRHKRRKGPHHPAPLAREESLPADNLSKASATAKPQPAYVEVISDDDDKGTRTVGVLHKSPQKSSSESVLPFPPRPVGTTTRESQSPQQRRRERPPSSTRSSTGNHIRFQ